MKTAALALRKEGVSNPNGRPLLFSRRRIRRRSRRRSEFPTRTGDLCYLAVVYFSLDLACYAFPTRTGDLCYLATQCGTPQEEEYFVSNPNGRPLLFSQRRWHVSSTKSLGFQPERATSAI